MAARLRAPTLGHRCWACRQLHSEPAEDLIHPRVDLPDAAWQTPSGLSSLMAESENTTGTTIGRRAALTYVVLGRPRVVLAHFPSDLVLLPAREACGTVLSTTACSPIRRSWKPDTVKFDPDRPGPLRCAAPAWWWIAQSQLVRRSRSESVPTTLRGLGIRVIPKAAHETGSSGPHPAWSSAWPRFYRPF
jgi:hypothetical protein